MAYCKLYTIEAVDGRAFYPNIDRQMGILCLEK
jgi:hypothetical protein